MQMSIWQVSIEQGKVTGFIAYGIKYLEDVMDKNKWKLGFALTNPGLMEATEEAVREVYPSLNDEKVAKEVQKVLKHATLFNDKNKKSKKAKKPKPEKEPK